jgi:hypothetical protein
MNTTQETRFQIYLQAHKAAARLACLIRQLNTK